MKPSFKEYLESSKEQLKKAIENTPVTIIEYEVRKYCTITLGECSDESVSIPLKPHQTVTVRWSYSNPTKPVPDTIRIGGGNILVENEEYTTFWTTEKLQKWLQRHTSGGENYGHKI